MSDPTDPSRELINGRTLLRPPLYEGWRVAVFDVEPISGVPEELEVWHLGDALTTARALNLIRPLTRVRDPALNRVTEVWSDGGDLWIASERPLGTTLRAHVQREPPASLTRACALGLQLIEATQEVNAQLPNLPLVTSLGAEHVRVTHAPNRGESLTLVRWYRDALAEVIREGALVSDPSLGARNVHALPPECLSGEFTLEGRERAQQYVVGLAMCELLLGRPLFDPGDAPIEVISRHARGVLHEQAVRDAIKDWPPLRKALAVDPAERYDTLQEMANALAAWPLQPIQRPEGWTLGDDGGPMLIANPKGSRYVGFDGFGSAKKEEEGGAGVQEGRIRGGPRPGAEAQVIGIVVMVLAAAAAAAWWFFGG